MKGTGGGGSSWESIGIGIGASSHPISGPTMGASSGGDPSTPFPKVDYKFMDGDEPKMTVTHVVQARGDTHGPRIEQAQMAQDLKDVVRAHPGWARMPADQRDSIEMILMKISRIVVGNNDELDHWVDISGYAMLCCSALGG